MDMDMDMDMDVDVDMDMDMVTKHAYGTVRKPELTRAACNPLSHNGKLFRSGR